MKALTRWMAAAALAVFAAAGAQAQEIKISHQFKANADARDLAAREFVKEVNQRDPNLKFRCAVERRCLPVGANPTRQLSLQPEAIGAIVEATKRLKPSV